MIRLFIILLFAAVAQAKVVCQDPTGLTNGTWTTAMAWDGTNRLTCSGAVRPVHYVLTNDAESIVNMRTLVQAVVDDAWRGDFIKFTAQQAFAFTNASAYGVLLRRVPGDSGYLTITTTEYDKLPNEGTRITPAYMPLMPKLYVSANSFVIGLAGAGRNSADHIKIRGIAFVPDPAMSSTLAVNYGYIKIGGSVSWSKAQNTFMGDQVIYTTGVRAAAAAGATTVQLRDASGLQAGDKVQIGTNVSVPVTIESVNTSTPGGHFVTLNSPGLPAAVTTNSRVFGPPGYQPDDVVVQHNLFLNPKMGWEMERFVVLNGRHTTIRDNFFSSPQSAYGLKDTQCILGVHGPGPYIIENNYLDGGSENIMYGGGWSSLNNWSLFQGSPIRYNFLSHELSRDLMGPWKYTQDTYLYRMPSSISVPGLPHLSPRLVFAGRFIHRTVLNSGRALSYRAKNTGVVNTIEPDWLSMPDVAGSEIYDGDPARAAFGTTQCAGQTYAGDGVCWRVTNTTTSTGTARNLIKNNFELKAGTNVTLQYNVLDGYGPSWSNGLSWNANQSTMINIKSDPYAAGGTGDMACEVGDNWPLCDRPEVSNLRIENNILRNVYAGGVTLGGAASNYALTHTYYFRNNLVLIGKIVNVPDVPASLAALYRPLRLLESAGNNGAARIHRFDNLWVDNNTFYTESILPVHPLAAGGANGAGFGGTRSLSGNIFARGANGTFGVSEFATASQDWGSMLTDKFPGTNTGGVLGKNIMLGAKAIGFPGDTIWTGCPGADKCITSTGDKPDWWSVFLNPEAGIFTLKDDQWGKRALPDGTDIGADPAQLPEIRNLAVLPTDRMVLFRWTLTQPIMHIPCAVEVHTAPDFESDWHGRAATYAGELSEIGTYYRADADDADRNTRFGQDRMATIGYAVPLTPSTTYYYRLHCGGDVRKGMFTTWGPATGTVEQTISRAVDNAVKSMDVEYGTSYSSAGDIISDGGISSSTCGVDQMCSVSFTVSRGAVAYYRWIERDESGAVLRSSQVLTLVAE